MSRHRRPEGSRLPALERNILKYRAFEMMLTLYYAEEIKQFLVGTMKATDHWRDDSMVSERSAALPGSRRATGQGRIYHNRQTQSNRTGDCHGPDRRSVLPRV